MINEVSTQIHNQWMERNASPDQMIPYNLLPDDEKDKNTSIVDETVKALEFQKFISEELNNDNIKFTEGIFKGYKFINIHPSVYEIIDIILNNLSSENLLALCDKIEILRKVFEETKKTTVIFVTLV